MCDYDYQLLKIKDACKIYGFSPNKMKQVAVDAHADMRVGRSWRIHNPTLDAYFESLLKRGVTA